MSTAPDHEAYLHAAVLLALRAVRDGEDVSAAVDALAGMAGEDQPEEDE